MHRIEITILFVGNTNIHMIQDYSTTFLGSAKNVGKVTICLVMSVCPFVRLHGTAGLQLGGYP